MARYLNMNTVLNHAPGQGVSIVFEILDASGIRADGYGSTTPTINKVIFPNLSLATGYPTSMTKIATGLYIYKFTLPSTASAVGTYIVDLSYYDPDTTNLKQTFIQVVCSAPYGQYSVSSV